MPPQMAIPPPTQSYAAQGGSSTTTAALPQGPRPTTLDGAPSQGYHPLGYNPPGPSAHPSPYAGAYNGGGGSHHAAGAYNGEDDEGMWGAAKRWAQAAGGRLAEAEGEVWRRINKG